MSLYRSAPLLLLFAACSSRAAPPVPPCPPPRNREVAALTRRALHAASLDRDDPRRAPATLPRVRARVWGDRFSVTGMLLLDFDLPRALGGSGAGAGRERPTWGARAALADRVATLAAERARLRCPAARRLPVGQAARRELRLQAVEAELRALAGEVEP